MAYKRSKVCGVGINDALYPIESKGDTTTVRNRRGFCVYYVLWGSMLSRAYNVKYHSEFPTYRNVVVCEEWLTFSNFREWVVGQEKEHNISLETHQLDKDLLVEGNKEYSPSTCVFVSERVNLFLLGVNFEGRVSGVDRRGATYRVQVRDSRGGRYTKQGFRTEIEAFSHYIEKKLEVLDVLRNDGLVSDDLYSIIQGRLADHLERHPDHSTQGRYS